MHRKRQNVYYVKLQEDISTLNSDQEYYMTITSIYGPESVRFMKKVTWIFKTLLLFQTSFELTIRPKNYSELSDEENNPSMHNIRSPSEASQTSGFDERSLDSAIQSPLRWVIEIVVLTLFLEFYTNFNRVKESSLELDSFVVTDTPLPDLEEITGRILLNDNDDDTDNEGDIEDEIKNPEVSEGSRKNSFLLVKKLIFPEVQYKWHRGFRRDINGRYIKVTVLKLQIKYEDIGGLVPWELHIYFITKEEVESENYKVVPISDNIATAEFTVRDADINLKM